MLIKEGSPPLHLSTLKPFPREEIAEAAFLWGLLFGLVFFGLRFTFDRFEFTWEGAALWPLTTTFKKLFKANMFRHNIPCGTLGLTRMLRAVFNF